MWRRGLPACRECKHAVNMWQQERTRRRVLIEDRPSIAEYVLSVLDLHWPTYMTLEELHDRVKYLYPNAMSETTRRSLYRHLRAGRVDLYGSRWRANPQ